MVAYNLFKRPTIISNSRKKSCLRPPHSRLLKQNHARYTTQAAFAATSLFYLPTSLPYLVSIIVSIFCKDFFLFKFPTIVYDNYELYVVIRNFINFAENYNTNMLCGFEKTINLTSLLCMFGVFFYFKISLELRRLH